MSAIHALRLRSATRLDLRALARFAGGLSIASFGMTLMLRTRLGAAPWEVFNSGLAARVGLSLGLVRYLVVIAIIAGVLALGARIGGALLATGFVGSTWMALYDIVVPQIGTGPVRIAVFAIGLFLMSIGVAVYLHAGLGAGPHDALILTTATRTRQTLLVARVACEMSALVVGALLGGAFGVGTVVFAIGLGPLIALVTVQLHRWDPLPLALPVSSAASADTLAPA